MKKVFLALFALVMSISANAFEFDGIDLNKNYFEIAQQISAKGYVYDDVNDCLKGNCQGTEITLSLKAEKSKLGQLIVDIPMADNAFENVTKTFNVVYHQIAKDQTSCTYNVSADGTTLIVSATAKGIRLTYNTPYLKK